MTNLAQRVAVGVVAIPAVFFLCIAGGLYFFGFIALVSAIALHEFYGLAEAKGARPLIALGILAGFFVNLSFFTSFTPGAVFFPASRPPFLVLLLVVTVVLASLTELFRKQDARGSPLLNVSTTMFGVLYVSLFFGTLIGIRES